MEAISEAFAGAFKTERLVFRAMEDTEAHKDWLFKNLWDNPVNFGLATPATFVPQTRKAFNKDIETITSNSLLAVFICLPKKKEEPRSAQTSDQAEEEEAGDDDKKKAAGQDGEGDVTKIGMMVMGKNSNFMFRRRTGIGIQIVDEHQNRGYGREAINWALDWAFTFGDMHRVDIGTTSYNERAAALYKSIGFRLEGVKRESVFMNRQWHDHIELGMLVHEWEELRGLSGNKHARTEVEK
ncbi:hypothetical protein LQW54_008369 [Pestalotiopsis sp. IQ-011]